MKDGPRTSQAPERSSLFQPQPMKRGPACYGNVESDVPRTMSFAAAARKDVDYQ